ncbi:hypothetical protein BJX99DRAFT_258753 [Aspergillus californicus]
MCKQIINHYTTCEHVANDTLMTCTHKYQSDRLAMRPVAHAVIEEHKYSVEPTTEEYCIECLAEILVRLQKYMGMTFLLDGVGDAGDIDPEFAEVYEDWSRGEMTGIEAQFVNSLLQAEKEMVMMGMDSDSPSSGGDTSPGSMSACTPPEVLFDAEAEAESLLSPGPFSPGLGLESFTPPSETGDGLAESTKIVQNAAAFFDNSPWAGPPSPVSPGRVPGSVLSTNKALRAMCASAGFIDATWDAECATEMA